MNREDFEKLVKAMKLVYNQKGVDYDLCRACTLLREIFNNNGGAERYLFQKD